MSKATNSTLAQLAQQWQLGDIPLLVGESVGISITEQFNITQSPTTLLIDADRLTLHRQDRFAPAQELALALQALVGSPTFE